MNDRSKRGGRPGDKRRPHNKQAHDKRSDAPRTKPGDEPLFVPKPGRGPGPGPLGRIDLSVEKTTRHPWIPRDHIKTPAAGGPGGGDAVAIYDRRHRFCGRGFYNPRSKIGARLLDPGGEGLDLGEGFVRGRVASALRLRRELLDLPSVTDAYRLINSEGDGLSGLIVDVYGSHATCELLSLGWYQRRAWIEKALRELVGVTRVHMRADARIEKAEGFSIAPQTEPVLATVTEHGVTYGVDLALGHKTGFFCDQRDNRLAVARLTRGMRVLDLCCYTGGFSLCASIVGGAADVTGVDLDEKAIAQAERNLALNEAANPDRLRFRHQNAFDTLRAAAATSERWDVIVLDPPKLVPNPRGMGKGLRTYFDLNRLAMRVVKPGGLLVTCSCSGLVSRERFLETLAASAFEANKRVAVLDVHGPGGDHPTDPACPENVYLKVALLEVR